MTLKRDYSHYKTANNKWPFDGSFLAPVTTLEQKGEFSSNV